MKVLITGESHVGVLFQGHAVLLNSAEIPTEIEIVIKPLGGGHLMPTPFFSDRGDFVEIVNEEYRTRIQQLPLSDQEYDWYGLSAPLHTARVYRMSDWKEFSPFGLKGKAPISKSLLHRVVQDDQRYVMQLIEALKRIGVRLFIVEPPRPFRHHPATSEYGPEIVSYVDTFYRDKMKEWLAFKEVPVVDVPKDSYDEDGFTYEMYRHVNPKDFHHANKEFGALMMKGIVDFLYPGKATR